MQDTYRGWGSGLLAVAIFSGSMPATRMAVLGFSPLLLTSMRALIAGGLAFLLLAGLRQPRPTHRQWQQVAVVAGCCVIGFPLLSALALQHMSSARSLVFMGLLPLSTAIFGVVRGGERPSSAFWAFALLGALAVAGFALTKQAHSSALGDSLMILAIIVCGLGYAEGAVLTRELGGWQVISWALLLCVPLAIAGTIAFWPRDGIANVGMSSWLGLAYVSVFSMLIGFIFWYRGLSLGGIAKIGQLQLLQPFLGLGLAAFLLREHVAPGMLAATMLVVASVAGAKRFA
ncbi:drug/metabolite transporter (DMT)-like permease [Novosphingobium sp. PhB165]|uniref:DMT family transporter n=1 Tax=Novosphingobium sp. PhB165 TaxID=2485105 RepID=UPI00104742FC|nr:DMT family transporter [Novosphingobium sp. PhB165]TCM20551.1 drug/metabolite transporter (DMT)-like permease [Novosphingobium sp. PhB165]